LDKRLTVIFLFVSLLLVTITPLLIPDIPTRISQNTYKYEFGYPFNFVEQEVGIIVSHGTLNPHDV
jgi:hypothetical protein